MMNTALTPDSYKLFDELCDLSAEKRGAFLEGRVPDLDLRRKLEHMLEHFEQASLGLGGLPEVDTSGAYPERIGPYAVKGVLGTGGMGVVYLAEQKRPRREVAVKVMHGGHGKGKGELARRFELEAEFLGRLQHPGIAQILESGVEGEGDQARLFLAMEYVAGKPITTFSRDAEMALPDRIELLIQVTEAIHHAHVRGVIHRDLKPDNILVTAEGQVKVIDFGVARATERGEDVSQHTRTGEIVGTLAYMAPEQMRGDVEGIDTRTDVYALGVVAYELLAGQLPHDVSGKPITEVAELLCHREPVPVGRLAEDCRGDLECIVARAMEKEPARRYQSAGALRNDLARYLAHEPIEARPASTAYQLLKLARRHRVAVAGIVATLVAILVGGGFAVHYGMRNADLAQAETEAREQADQSAREAFEFAEAEKRARKAADDNAAGLKRVADFLSKQLAAISPQLMGRQIAIGVDSELQRTADREGDLPGLREAMLRVNMTNVAADTIKGALLLPMRARIRESFQGRPVLMIEMLAAHARQLAGAGLLDLSYAVYLEILEFGADLPPETPELLRAQIGYGTDLGRSGQWSEIKTLLEPVLALGRTALGVRDPALLNGFGALARAEQFLGNTGAAEALYREQIALLEKLVEADRDAQLRYDSLIALNNLGNLLIDSERPEEAESIIEAMHDLLDGEADSPGELIVITLKFEAVARLAMGDLIRGEEAAWKALEACNRVSGNVSASASGVRRILIDFLEREERHDEAETLLRTELAAHEKLVGKGNFNYVLTELKLAEALIGQGKRAAAQPILEEALGLAQANLGPSNDLTAFISQLLEKTD